MDFKAAVQNTAGGISVHLTIKAVKESDRDSQKNGGACFTRPRRKVVRTPGICVRQKVNFSPYCNSRLGLVTVVAPNPGLEPPAVVPLP